MSVYWMNITIMLLILANIIITSLFSITIFLRYKKTHIQGLLYLLIVYLSSFPLQVIYFSLSIINFNDFNLVFILSEDNSLITMLGVVLAGTLLLFVDYFQKESISTIKAVFFSVVLTSIIIITVFYSLTDNNQLSEVLMLYSSFELVINGFFTFILNFIPIIFFLYVIISTISNIQKIKKYTFDKNQKKQLSLMQTSIITYLLLVPFNELFLIGFDLKDNMLAMFLLGNVFPDLFLLLGTILLWYAYVYTPRTAFLQGQRINQLIVITKTGLPLFTYSFQQQNVSGTDAVLFSGGLSAIESLLKEAVGTTSAISAIKFQNKAIMINVHENVGIFLISDRTSRFLQQSLEHFANEFLEMYDLKEEGALDDFCGDITKYEGANKLVERIFGLFEIPKFHFRTTE